MRWAPHIATVTAIPRELDQSAGPFWWLRHRDQCLAYVFSFHPPISPGKGTPIFVSFSRSGAEL